MTQTATVKTAQEICRVLQSLSYGISCNEKCQQKYHIVKNIKFLERCSSIDVSLIKEKYGLQ